MTAPQKILVVALDNLGDAVMASAILTPLKKAFPSSTVGVWAKRYTAGLFDGHPAVDRLHAADPFWDGSPGRESGSLLDFLSAIRVIRAERYDVALLLNTEWRRALAVRFAGVSRRIGYDRRHSRPLLTHVVPVAPLIQHFIDDHRILMEQGLGLRVEDPFTEQLAVSASDQALWNSWSAASGVKSQRYWIAHLFSGDSLKNWPIANWRSLIVKNQTRWPDLRCVVLLGPSERAKISVADWEFFERETFVLDSPELGLLKAAVASAAGVVDGDSGPGHVAAALQTPVVSLFGKTNPLRSRPVGRAPARIVTAGAVIDIGIDDVASAMDIFEPRV